MATNMVTSYRHAIPAICLLVCYKYLGAEYNQMLVGGVVGYLGHGLLLKIEPVIQFLSRLFFNPMDNYDLYGLFRCYFYGDILHFEIVETYLCSLLITPFNSIVASLISFLIIR